MKNRGGGETVAKASNNFSMQCKIHVSILQTLTGDVTHVMHCLLFSSRAHSIALLRGVTLRPSWFPRHRGIIPCAWTQRAL